MAGQRSSQALNESEGFAHIASYLQSGLRASEYYRSQHLPKSRFYNWLRRYKLAHPELSEAKAPAGEKRFHEVKFGKESLAVPALGGLEIHYPNGVKVVFPAENGLDTEMLLSLIKLSVSCSV
jgi:hypothetical protein